VDGYAVYRNRDPRSWRIYPYLVDVQATALDGLATRVVVPLTRASGATQFPLLHLMSAVRLEDRSYIAVTPQLSAVERSALGARIGALSAHSRNIESAIGLLLRGF
jgi:toxin CcdB